MKTPDANDVHRKHGKDELRDRLDKNRKTRPLSNDPDVEPPKFSDAAVALTFTDRHAEHVRYVAFWNKWLHWNGTRWAVDETRHTFSMALRICKEVAQSVPPKQTKLARLIASSKTRAAVVALASEDRRIATTHERWDLDIFTFNTERRK